MIITITWLLHNQDVEVLNERKTSTREHVEVAMGVLQSYHQLQVEGKLTKEQAQDAAKATIEKLRYSKKEYFWINDMTPKVIMHPTNPALNGKDVSDIKDPNGVYLFKEFVKTVQQSQKGYVFYAWPQPGAKEPVPKLSYVSGFSEWGWVIGTGIYIDDLEAAHYERLYMTIAFTVLAFMGSLYLFIGFYKVNQGGFSIISSHLRELAEGDLRRIPNTPWGLDEPAFLIKDMQHLYESLHELIRKVRHSAKELQTASSEISMASLDLSQRSEQSAATLEEQAAAMEEIGQMVQKNSDNAADAANFAQENARVASNTGTEIRSVVHIMDTIHQSSSKIQDIIGTIDGIAFQTNILALNAAVEAARAGEQGRGFAVVASEVRALAKRSADAAKEIKGLITESVSHIEEGTKVTTQAGASMHTVVENAQKIESYLSEIAQASKEQSIGVTQSTQAIQLLDTTTQQNAAVVEETTAAAQGLLGQANILQEEISNFRVR